MPYADLPAGKLALFFQITPPEKLRIYSHLSLLPFYFCLSHKLALFFSNPINRGVRGERRGNNISQPATPTRVITHQKLRALSVLGGKTIELALFGFVFSPPKTAQNH
jgi:hypothetical protein